jgi:hypothetical protein
VQKAIDQFQTEADEIIQLFVEGLKAKKPPPIIYHCTEDSRIKGNSGNRSALADRRF